MCTIWYIILHYFKNHYCKLSIINLCILCYFATKIKKRGIFHIFPLTETKTYVIFIRCLYVDIIRILLVCLRVYIFILY